MIVLKEEDVKETARLLVGLQIAAVLEHGERAAFPQKFSHREVPPAWQLRKETMDE